MSKFTAHVHVHEYDKDRNVVRTEVFAPGDDVPKWAEAHVGDHVHDGGHPGRPAGNASLADWQDYALSQGATSDEIDGKTRDELREQFGA
jgi:hypothetical protein